MQVTSVWGECVFAAKQQIGRVRVGNPLSGDAKTAAKGFLPCFYPYENWPPYRGPFQPNGCLRQDAGGQSMVS